MLLINQNQIVTYIYSLKVVVGKKKVVKKKVGKKS